MDTKQRRNIKKNVRDEPLHFISRNFGMTVQYNRLIIRDLMHQVQESERIEKFMLDYEPRHLLRSQIIRSYSMMPDLNKLNHRECL
jgi:hypothetical protein